MSNPYQNPNYYQTPNPNPPQQPEQYIQSGQPLSSTGNYNDPDQQAYSYYPEGSLQPQPSGQRHGSRSPNVGNMTFPEQHHGSSAGHQQTYIAPSQTTPNLTVPTHHQHGRRGSHGHSPTGSYSDGQGLYSAGAGSDTGSGSNFYPPQPGVQPHYEGDYTATATQPQAVYDEEHDSRSKAPPSRPADYSNRLCRFPRCTRVVFFDRRVNEYREWCSDQHMQAAIRHGVERPCSYCQTFPRRNGHRHCSEVCRYRGH